MGATPVLDGIEELPTGPKFRSVVLAIVRN